jgi:methyltransferase family protein
MLKTIVKRIPIVRDVARKLLGIGASGRQRNFDSGEYWEARYRAGGKSGAGSYDRLAHFKAEVLNGFVAKHGIVSVIEFGCGDGAQLSLAAYPDYVGLDISPTVLEMARKRFASDETKRFVLLEDATSLTADLALSLDVIYHLIEDAIFERHMHGLFAAARKHVIIYSSNEERRSDAVHVRHRRFTDWVERNESGFALIDVIPNRYSFDSADADHTSFADFFFFRRNAR